MNDKPNMNDGVTVTTIVEAFTATDSDGLMSVVRQEELGTKFK
jgi:hypothetical protein